MSRRIVLRAFPAGAPTAADFEIVDGSAPTLADGEVLLEVTHLSMDPFPRLRMCDKPMAGPPIRPGELVDSRGIGRVLESRHPDFHAGDYAAGDVGWQEQVALPADRLHKLDLSLGLPQQHLGILGPSGLTAYFATHEVGRPRDRETVLIAPAAGSVGSLAGQIAALDGARVIGAGRGDRQCAALVDELGFGAAIDSDQPAELDRAAPDGIDLFIDGVGGALHDAVLARLNPRARIVLLGFISSYNDDAPPRYGNAASILFRRARMEGFLLADWEPRFADARRQLSRWLESGAIRPVESLWHGLDQAPAAFASLFAAAPPGKQIVIL
ncbi:MAG: NADP-dependent oxidoreductase [Sphingomonadaceae bacterium]|nr:NADP-dependent oxidoreductase [Sphingomonadaceae bacterium]